MRFDRDHVVMEPYTCQFPYLALLCKSSIPWLFLLVESMQPIALRNQRVQPLQRGGYSAQDTS